jgi:ABC-2 type transport system ATP-binding protein
MSFAAVELSDVSKSFAGTPVLQNVSVAFAQGGIHGIIGRNGSGKTVLMKCICGLIAYDSGSISVQGAIIGKDIEMPESCGIIIESPGFLPNCSGMKNLRFLASLKNKIGKKEISEAMCLVGLDPTSHKKVKNYSLGMKQRLGIAQAIMEDPDLLILDEPFNGLDKTGLQEMRALLLGFKEKGKTVIMASHSGEDIDVLCDTTYEIDKDGFERLQ